ncbi:MAG: hypothetical protein RLZ55_863 [Actinomycetota bacterium]|jgi:hypothetical protein
MTWGAVNAGQDAIDSLAASAQQLSWSSSNINDKAGATQIQAELAAYLNAFVTSDAEALAAGTVPPLPSARQFDQLQDGVHAVAYRGGDSVPEASGIVSAAAAPTAAQSKVTSVAQRALPPLLIVLILLSGALLAVGMGTAAAVERPLLMCGWAFVAALSLTMVLLLDYPLRRRPLGQPRPRGTGSAVRVELTAHSASASVTSPVSTLNMIRALISAGIDGDLPRSLTHLHD